MALAAVCFLSVFGTCSYAKEATSEPIQIVVLGDSIAKGYCGANKPELYCYGQTVAEEIAQGAGKSYLYQNYAKNGLATREFNEKVLKGQEVQDSLSGADVILITMGSNDLLNEFKKTAQEILNHVGGSKNIISAAHCATRLRLVIADNKKADKGALENVDGVKGVFEASGQLQIILGTGTVNKVFDQFGEIAGVTASSKAEAKEAAVQKQNWFMRAIKLLGDIFVPIIPAIVASGFLMGIMNSLDFMNTNNFIHIDTTSSLYVFANLFSNTAYTFLQILIAFSAAKAFGANPYLGAVIGMITICLLYTSPSPRDS